MAHDVFISHSTLDKPAADAVCHGLEARGVRCWMAPRDQIAGKAYGHQITEAIRDARVMVLIFSENVNNSQAVLNEINLAAAANVTIVPFRMAKVEFNSELNYYLGRTHWLDAFPPPLGPHIDALAATIRRNLPEPASDTATIPPVAARSTPASAPTPHPPPHRNNYMPLAIVGVVLTFVLIVVLIGVLGSRPPSPAAEQATNTIAAAVANAIQAGAKDDVQPPAPPPAAVNAPSSEDQQATDQDDDQAGSNAVGASNAPPPPHRGFFDRILHRSDQRHGADR